MVRGPLSRPSGALPLIRVGKQPYGILPIVGKRFVTSGSAVESRIGALLGVLRPMWELATGLVPTMTDGDVDKAKEIIQTNAWSQVAKYRDKDAGKAMCVIPGPFSEAQGSGRHAVVHALLAAVGFGEGQYNNAHIFNCNDFLPDPPYEAGTLVGVPWVMADAKDPKKEADDRLPLGDNNYLKQIAKASIQIPDTARPLLTAFQSGPALLQALVSYSVQMEQGDAVERFVVPWATVDGVTTMKTPSMPFVEARDDNEAMFTVETPRELANVAIPSVTGTATLGEYVSAAASVPIVSSPAAAHKAAAELDLSVQHLLPETQDLGAVKVSLDYPADRTVGEPNIAFHHTDAFAYVATPGSALAPIAGRMRETAARESMWVVSGSSPQGRSRPDRWPSAGAVTRPPPPILRSGSWRTTRLAPSTSCSTRTHATRTGILQGRHAISLASLMGHTAFAGLRDAMLAFIWSAFAFPWRPAGQQPSTNRARRSVPGLVDGVHRSGRGAATDGSLRLQEALDTAQHPRRSCPLKQGVGGVTPPPPGRQRHDLLLAEGTHQSCRALRSCRGGWPCRQGRCRSKRFNTTERGGGGQRLVASPPDDDIWPSDDVAGRAGRQRMAASCWAIRRTASSPPSSEDGTAIPSSTRSTDRVLSTSGSHRCGLAFGSPVGAARPRAAKPASAARRRRVHRALVNPAPSPARRRARAMRRISDWNTSRRSPPRLAVIDKARPPRAGSRQGGRHLSPRSQPAKDTPRR